MQSAHTAMLVAKMPIVLFFMARSPLEGLKPLVWRRVQTTARTSPHLELLTLCPSPNVYNCYVRRQFLDGENVAPH
jgi:hypothetical protein